MNIEFNTIRRSLRLFLTVLQQKKKQNHENNRNPFRVTIPYFPASLLMKIKKLPPRIENWSNYPGRKVLSTMEEKKH